MADSPTALARQHLIEGLIGSSERNLELFRNSPEFHAAIYSLADTLPFWVNGIADEAEKITGKRKEAMERLNQAPEIHTMFYG